VYIDRKGGGGRDTYTHCIYELIEKGEEGREGRGGRDTM
jgi:hypothetical protein